MTDLLQGGRAAAATKTYPIPVLPEPTEQQEETGNIVMLINIS